MHAPQHEELPGNNLRERLEEFYRRHNPGFSNIDKVLEVYKNMPDCVFPELDKKYSTNYSRPEELEANRVRLEERERVKERIREQRRQEEVEGRSIKLGLGDFVFYSVAIAASATYGWTEAATVFVVILMVRA